LVVGERVEFFADVPARRLTPLIGVQVPGVAPVGQVHAVLTYAHGVGVGGEVFTERARADYENLAVGRRRGRRVVDCVRRRNGGVAEGDG